MLNTQRKVSFYTLGCKLNYAETSTISRIFENEGYLRVDFNEQANVIVINTCSVTQLADKKSRQIISKASRISPGAIVVVTGCYSQLKPEEISHLKGVDLVLGTKDKFNIIQFLKELDEHKTNVPRIHSCHTGNIEEFYPSFSLLDRTRSFLKIQDGCNYHCSYCAIPSARGPSRNNTIANTLAETRKIAREGIKEIVLTGVNIGDFGQSTQESLIDLLFALDNVDGIERFRISSIEPNLLTNEIISFITTSKLFVPHFHIPLQSGSNDILKLMARRYSRELFLDRVKTIKSKLPHACIGADVIVGFPGETDRLFNETKQFIDGLDVSYLHVFPYSERPNTRAILFQDKIPQKVKDERSKMLIELSESKRNTFYNNQVGKLEKVLIESEHEKKWIGYTSNYIKTETENIKPLFNQTVTVQLLELLPSGNMKGIIINE